MKLLSNFLLWKERFANYFFANRWVQLSTLWYIVRTYIILGKKTFGPWVGFKDFLWDMILTLVNTPLKSHCKTGHSQKKHYLQKVNFHKKATSIKGHFLKGHLQESLLSKRLCTKKATSEKGHFPKGYYQKRSFRKRLFT